MYENYSVGKNECKKNLYFPEIFELQFIFKPIKFYLSSSTGSVKLNC